MSNPTPSAVETKNILPLGLLAAAGFLSVAGARAVDPLLSLMARDFATSVPALSAMIAAFTLAYGMNQLLLGPLGDRCGKLRILLGALVANAVFTTACAWAGSLAALTVLRACAGAASAGLIPVCLAYIGDAVPYDRRQIMLSRFATGIVMAQILAGPLGGAVGQVSGWRGVFVLLGLGGLGVAAGLATRLRHLPDRSSRHASTLATYRALSSRPDARLLLAATLTEGALTGGMVPFLAPYLHDRFALPYATVGLVLACFGLGTFAYTRAARFILPRADEARLVLVGGLLIATALAAVMTSHGWAPFVPAQAVIGFGYLMMHTVLQSRATELLPDARSTAVSLFVFALFLGQALGAVAFGATIATWGYRFAFWGGALALSLLGCGLWTLMRSYPAAAQTA